MRFASLAFIAITLAAPEAARAVQHAPPRGSHATVLDSFISRAFELDLTPGLAVAVVEGDRVIYSRGLGYADIEARRRVVADSTLFYIASTSKSFTAFLAATLDHRGRLDLDAPISRYLPELRFQPPLSAEEITLRDLLTHTHGIASDGLHPVVVRTAYTGVYTDSLLIDLLGEYPPSPTGRAYNYGNLGYNIAGLVIDAVMERGWKDLQRDEVFLPAGMRQTTAGTSRIDRGRLALPHAADPVGYHRIHFGKADANMHAAGGHLTTALDLARWLEAHMNDGRIDGRQVFPAEVVAETHRQQATQDRDFAYFHRYGWGLGWDLGTYEGDTLIHRFGGFPGFRSHVSFMPRHGIGVVALVNSNIASRLTDLVAAYAYDLLLGKPGLEEKYERLLPQVADRAENLRRRIAEDRAERAARQEPLPYPLSAYGGTYENRELGRMEWRVVNGALRAEMGVMRSGTEVHDAAANQLRVELRGRGEVVEFVFEDGEAVTLTYMGRNFTRVP